MIITITRWKNLLDPAGERVETTWENLYLEFAAPLTVADKADIPGWSPAVFDADRRALAGVSRVFGICLDYDHGETIEGTAGRLGAIAGGFLHTSWSHTPEAHRFRVILPLSRPVSAFEYGELWKRVAEHVGSVDQAPKDPSRLWFVPAKKPGGEYRCQRLPGGPLNVDQWLARPDPTLRRERVSAPATGVSERARRYIAKMPAAISGAGGHQATWDVAIVLARGFALSEEETFAILWNDYNPRCQPAWSQRELRHKARGAASANRAGMGFLLEDQREWPEHSPDWQPPPEPETEFYDREPGDDSDEEPVRQEPKYPVVLFSTACAQVAEQLESGKKTQGLTTGHIDLDTLISGYRAEMVTTFGAGTSFGKSSFAIMAADENLKVGQRILVVTGEDSVQLYGKRIVARRLGLNAINVRDNDVTPDELKRVKRLARSVAPEPFIINGIGVPVEDIAEAISRACEEYQIKLVICDYLQVFRTRARTQDRRNEVTMVMQTLSHAIKRAGAAGLMLSQLKRLEPGKEPEMDDLKESGDVENESDHIILGWRVRGGKPYYDDEEPPMKRYVKVPKNKDGPVITGKIELPFDMLSASFVTEMRPAAQRGNSGPATRYPYPDNDFDPEDGYDSMAQN